MTQLKFPYTMHCPSCKVGIKIKSAKSIGTIISCPKCKKRIEVVRPEDDGYIPYDVGPAPPPHVPKPPTEEELEELEEKERKERHEVLMRRVKYGLGIVIILAQLSFMGYLWYKKVWVEGYQVRKEEKKPQYQKPR